MEKQSTAQHKLGSEPYVGAWTSEEKQYASALIQEFRDGNIPGLKGKETMRGFLAEQLGCLTKRISKKYEKSGYNGRLQYRSGVTPLAPEVAKERQDKLKELEQQFRKSRATMIQLRESNVRSKERYEMNEESKAKGNPQNQPLSAPTSSLPAGARVPPAAAALPVDLTMENALLQVLVNHAAERDIAAARAAALINLPSATTRNYIANPPAGAALDLLHLGSLGTGMGTSQNQLAGLFSNSTSSLRQPAQPLTTNDLLNQLSSFTQSTRATPSGEGGLLDFLQRKRELAARLVALQDNQPVAKRPRLDT